MYPPGNSRRTVRLDLVRAMRPQIVEMGLASGQELDELDAVARPHLEDSRTVAMSGLLFLVWGASPFELVPVLPVLGVDDWWQVYPGLEATPVGSGLASVMWLTVLMAAIVGSAGIRS